jgi:hypothetical protein
MGTFAWSLTGISMLAGRNAVSLAASPDLINTPLQRGVVRARWQETVSTVSCTGVAGSGHSMILQVSLSLTRRRPISWWSNTSIVGRRIETVETVSMSPAPNATPLKRGVNERFAEPGV